MRSASTTELDRLESQLAALHASPHPETDDQRELRALVEHQLEVVRRMHARADALAHRRARLLHLLRGLWAQVCLFRSESSTALTPAPAVHRLRALCVEIAEEIDSGR